MAELKRPEGWSDAEWAEYLAWHESLPEDIETEGSRHAVMIGSKDAITAPAAEPDEGEDQAEESPEEESDATTDAEAPDQRPPQVRDRSE